MKKLLLLFCILGCSLFCNEVAAQEEVTVSGTVTVAGTKDPLPYATITSKEGINGTNTDMDGKYTISVPANSTLVFSFIGYTSQEIVVTPARTTIDVALAEDSQMLEAVVAVGYGTMRKSDVTGAVSSISSELIKAAPVASVEQAMQGRVAGVTITTASGQPGATSEVRVRGIGTIGDSAPIYVVDGVITDNISFLNANDIESMEVLKDASSTAIYGSRGANGVIIVTTKSGSEGRTNVSFEAYVGIQNRWRKLDLMGPYEQALTELQIKGRESELNFFNRYGLDLWLKNYKINPNKNAEFPVNLDYSTVNTDWQDEVFRANAVIQNYHVSVDGGTDKAQYSLSTGYFSQDGTIMASWYNRLTLRGNATFKIAKWLRVNTNVTYVTSKSRSAPNNDAVSSVLTGAIRMAPWDPTHYPAGSVDYLGNDMSGKIAAASNFANIYNPFSQTTYAHPNNRDQRWIANIALEIEPIEGLVIRPSVSANLNTVLNRNFYDAYLVSSAYDKRDKNFLESNMGRYNTMFYETTATYSKRFNEKHNFSVMIGTTTEEYNGYWIGGSGSSIINPTPNNWYLSQTTENRNYASDSVARTRRLSFLGRLFYSYDERYLITVNFRADGSSKFPENTWGFFPSAALAWRISEESFLKDSPILDNLKLRLGWGQIGNDKIDESSFVQVMENQIYYNGYAFGSGQTWDSAGAQGAAILTYINQGGRWEVSEQLNLGLDFGLWGNKFYGTVDAYIRDTKEMLLQVVTPAPVGNRFYPQANIGTVRNQGIELSLGHANNVSENFSYDITANLSFVKNRLTHLNGGSRVEHTSGVQVSDEGLPLFSFWGYEYEGIYQSDAEVAAHQWGVSAVNITEHAGDARYKDQNGDGIIDGNDEVALGSPFPWLTGGLNATFRFYGVDVSLFFQGTYGGKVYNALRTLTEGDGSSSTLSTSMRNVWTAQNPNGTIPSVSPSASTRNQLFSSRLVEDSSYLRLKNIQIGYTLPQHITKKAHISRLRFYVQMSNAFTITGYSGFDPEVGGGVDWGNYPQSRTILFGTNINF